MPTSMLLSCTGFTLIELTAHESKHFDALIGSYQGYLYMLAEDVTAVVQTRSLGPVTLTLRRGLLVDGETNPIKDVLPKSFTRFIDSYATAEWLVHDYLYGAELDPKSPLTVPIPLEEKDAVFSAAYRRGACVVGGAICPGLDLDLENHYADDTFLEQLLQEHRELKRPVIESHPIDRPDAKHHLSFQFCESGARTLAEPIYRLAASQVAEGMRMHTKFAAAFGLMYREGWMQHSKPERSGHLPNPSRRESPAPFHRQFPTTDPSSAGRTVCQAQLLHGRQALEWRTSISLLHSAIG